MSKKILLISVLLISLTAMSVIEVNAYPPTLGGWGLFPKCVLCSSLWKGVANTDIKPTYVECRLELILVQVRCMNNGGQDGGLGNPFYWDSDVAGYQTLTTKDLVGKGKAESEIQFTDQVLFESLFCQENAVCPPYTFPDGICINPNWLPMLPSDGGEVVVRETDVQIRGFVDDGLGGYLEVVHVVGNCELSSDGSEYLCTQSYYWDSKSRESHTCWLGPYAPTP